MALLGLCELALSFLVIYGCCLAPDVLPVAGRHAGRGAQRVRLSWYRQPGRRLLACTVVITAAAIGLYRPEICIERRRLLINTMVAGLLAFPAVLVVTGSFNIGLSRHALLWLTKVLLVWLVCMVASRMIFNRVMRERWFVRRILVHRRSEAAARPLAAVDRHWPRPAVRAGVRRTTGRRTGRRWHVVTA